jgi:hypothetical protein
MFWLLHLFPRLARFIVANLGLRRGFGAWGGSSFIALQGHCLDLFALCLNGPLPSGRAAPTLALQLFRPAVKN